MKILALIGVAAALAFPLPALATFSGNDLLTRCGASEKSLSGEKLTADEMLDSMWCVGYLSGLLDGFGVADFRVSNQKMVCPPATGLSRSQALGIIVRYLRDHPDDRAKSGRRLALVALSKALPCR
jgi:hypothetical protein